MGAVLAVGAMLVPSGVALAASGHRYLSSVSDAPPGTPLAEPGATAVNHASGDVFVAEPTAGVVDVFDAAGVYQTQLGEGLEALGVAVDEASGEVYVADGFGDVIDVFKPTGSGGYELLSEWSGAGTSDNEFGEVAGVAFDNSTSASDPDAGDVYLVDSGDGVVNVFKPKPAGAEETQEGVFLGTLKGGKLEEPNGATVDAATGQVLVADSIDGAIEVYSSSGTFERKLTGSGSPNGSFSGPEEEQGNVTAVAVEEASGDVFVAESERHLVGELSGSGEWLGWIINGGSGPLSSPAGVALAENGDVYVADAGSGTLYLFGPGVTVPDATTTAAKKVAKTSAMLEGVVNGDGSPAEYRFQWGTSEALGSETTTTGAGSGEEDVSLTLGELQAGTTYYFRLVTENANGANYGIVREFTTRPAVEALSTGAVKEVMPTSATLTGSLNPKGTDAHYYFEWGQTTTYGNQIPTPPGDDAGAGTQPVQAEAALAALTPNTTYHYRILGTDTYGTTTGTDETFTTSGPPRVTSEPTSGIGHEEATIHADIDPDKLATEYHFEYGESKSYGAEAPVGGGQLAAGETPVAVSATLSEFGGARLELGVTYHFRVVATNSAGTVYGPDRTFTTVAAAVIESEYTTGISASEVVLHTQINPLGNDTHYYFQYGTESCQANPGACTDTPIAPGTDIGAGGAGIAESAELKGLTADTSYDYRVLASNTLGTSEGAEHTFTTQPAEPPSGLADNRAWEMVSPPDKHGAAIEGLTEQGGFVLAAENGDALTYVANGATSGEPQGNRSPEMQQMIATRSETGWATQDIATPQTKAQGVNGGYAPEYQLFSSDLSLALVEPWGGSALSEPPLAPEATQKTIYIRDNATGSYLPLVTEANVPPGTHFGLKLRFYGATPDLSHVVMRSDVGLTAGQSGPGLYEWQHGELRLVSVLPDGTAAGEAELGFAGHVLAHAISNDGTRIIWTNKIAGVGHLYMRDTATGQTLQLDGAHGVSEPPVGSAEFQSASADGSKVFFTDKQQLTPDSTAEPAQGTGKPDLYECDVVEEAGTLSCHLKDLTVDQLAGEHANVLGFIFGASEDAGTLYLVARGVLAGNENGHEETPEPGAANLYGLYVNGTQWETRFIATLSPEDGPEWEGEGQANMAYLTARVSPDGRYLAFMSAASLTGYDNVNASPAANGAHDEEVYLYDASSSTLTCASCNPTGARPVGVLDTEQSGEGLGLVADRRKIWLGHWLAGNIPGWTAQSITTALVQSRYLSDNGRLFFNSADALVPQVKTPTRQEEVEGKEQSVGVENVYEYEPTGVGSCQSASGGCVALLSSGTSAEESAFVEATPSGDDVFFLTAARLVPQDTDTAFDIYDARVCTPQSPCVTPPVPAPAGCSGADACRPAEPSQQTPVSPAGTAALSGPGNAVYTPPAEHGNLGERVTSKKGKALTRAQKLAKALAACRRLKGKRQRFSCEARARKRYGPKGKKSSKKARAKRRSGPNGKQASQHRRGKQGQ